MDKMLNDAETYRPIKTNPLVKINNKLNNIIKSWFDCQAIDEPTFKSLKCSNGNLPRCYAYQKSIKKMFLSELSFHLWVVPCTGLLGAYITF